MGRQDCTTRRAPLLVAALALVLAWAPISAASDGDGAGLMTAARTGPALPTRIVTLRDHAIVGTDAGIHVIAIDEPLVLLGQVELMSGVRDIAALDASTVAVAAGDRGLLIVSVADPHAPEVLGSFPIGNALAVGADAQGITMGVTADGQPRLLSLDVSDPATPRLVGALDLPGRPTAIEIIDGIIAVSIEAPPLVMLATAADGTLTRLGSLATSLPPRRLRHSGSRLLVACGMPMAGEVIAVDLSDPFTPTRVGGIRLAGEVVDILPRGDRVDVAAFDLGVLVVDAPPTAPWRHVATLPASGYAVAVAPGSIDGDFFVGTRSSSGAGGVMLARAADAGLSQPGESIAMAEVVDVARTPGFAFVLRRDGLDIIGGPLPGQARPETGRWTEPGANFSRVSVHGSLAAIASGAIVDILDVSVPTAPLHVGQLSVTRGVVTSMSMDGKLLSVAQGRDAEFFDLSVPSRPRRAAVLDIGGECTAVASECGHTVIVAGDRLISVDSSDADRPTLLGWTPLPRRSHSVSLDCGMAAIGSLLGGVLLVDVTDPTAPRATDGAETAPVVSVSLDGARVAVAEMEHGVSVFGRRAGGGLLREAWLDLPGAACAVNLDGLLLDVAATGAGSFHLVQLRPSPAFSQPATTFAPTSPIARSERLLEPQGRAPGRRVPAGR